MLCVDFSLVLALAETGEQPGASAEVLGAAGAWQSRNAMCGVVRSDEIDRSNRVCVLASATGSGQVTTPTLEYTCTLYQSTPVSTCGGLCRFGETSLQVQVTIQGSM